MKSEDLNALISYRLERAAESLMAAKMMLDNGMPIFSMNRVYYCLFYSIQALLALEGVSFSKHGQLKGYFSREYIKTGKLPKDMGRLFNKAFEYRQKFDYVDFAIPAQEMVSEYIEKARAFHKTVQEFITRTLK